MTGPSPQRSSTPTPSLLDPLHAAVLPECITDDNGFSFKTTSPLANFKFDANINTRMVESSRHTDGSKGQPIHGSLEGLGELEQSKHIPPIQLDVDSLAQDNPFAVKDTILHLSLTPRAQVSHGTQVGAAILDNALSGLHIKEIEDPSGLGVPSFKFPAVVNVGTFCCKS